MRCLPRFGAGLRVGRTRNRCLRACPTPDRMDTEAPRSHRRVACSSSYAPGGRTPHLLHPPTFDCPPAPTTPPPAMSAIVAATTLRRRCARCARFLAHFHRGAHAHPPAFRHRFAPRAVVLPMGDARAHLAHTFCRVRCHSCSCIPDEGYRMCGG